MKQHHIVPYGLKVLVSVVVMLPGFIMAQENTGTSRQPLVHGSLVSEANQEDFGLLTFQYMTATSTTSCSASLLRNQWVIIAAHCVDAVNSSGQPMPDPARPGQNVLKSIAQMTLSAGGWHNPQAKGVIRVETFRPYDVAIIQVANPFNIHGSTTGYSRLIFQDGQFPYFGNPIGASLIMFGRGINKLASAEGASAKPSEMDGFYRVAYAKPSYTKDNLYWYPSENGYMIAGGDSGGPSYAWVLGGYALVGVHSKTKVTYVPGMPQTWDWATSTPEAGDCQITGVWNSILGIIGPPPPPSSDSDTLLEPPPPGFIGTFAQTPPDFQPFFIYGIRPNGELLWYRKDSKASAWQGPKTVGTSWNHFKDVISAGGNRLYALTQDNKLLWYQHDGSNTMFRRRQLTR